MLRGRRWGRRWEAEASKLIIVDNFASETGATTKPSQTIADPQHPRTWTDSRGPIHVDYPQRTDASLLLHPRLGHACWTRHQKTVGQPCLAGQGPRGRGRASWLLKRRRPFSVSEVASLFPTREICEIRIEGHGSLEHVTNFKPCRNLRFVTCRQ